MLPFRQCFGVCRLPSGRVGASPRPGVKAEEQARVPDRRQRGAEIPRAPLEAGSLGAKETP